MLFQMSLTKRKQEDNNMKKRYEQVKYKLLMFSPMDLIAVSDDIADDIFDPVQSDISW